MNLNMWSKYITMKSKKKVLSYMLNNLRGISNNKNTSSTEAVKNQESKNRKNNYKINKILSGIKVEKSKPTKECNEVLKVLSNNNIKTEINTSELKATSKQKESKLLMKLKGCNEIDSPVLKSNLNKIIQLMQIDHNNEIELKKASKDFQNTLAVKKSYSNIIFEQGCNNKPCLFTKDVLNIFYNKKKCLHKKSNLLEIWSFLAKKNLTEALICPPSNYFQDISLKMFQEKIWKFPINNEEKLLYEAKCHFSDHVLLENDLNSWCPPGSTLKYFMEQVCCGLSKNHYFSVEEKRKHILWYKNYFNQNQSINAKNEML